MGFWGAGVFQNDHSLDMQFSLETLLDRGASIEEAVKALIDGKEEALHDSDDDARLIAVVEVLGLAWLVRARTPDVPESLRRLVRLIVENDVYVSAFDAFGERLVAAYEQSYVVAVLDGETPHPGMSDDGFPYIPHPSPDSTKGTH